MYTFQKYKKTKGFFSHHYKSIGTVLVLVLLFLFTIIPRFGDPTSCPKNTKVEIYVVQHRYHTALVIPTSYLSVLPNKKPFTEIAWGDKGYYMETSNISNAIPALLWPTPSVLHVVQFSDNPSHYFQNSPVTKLQVCKPALQRMGDFINHTFAKNTQEKTQVYQTGYYKNSYFYAAAPQYHLLYNCNNWTAEVLRKGGFTTAWWCGFPFSVYLYLN